MTQAATGSTGQVLKTGARRTVSRQEVDGASRIVKRYHAPGLLDRARDRYRARREHAALARLRERGLPVPRALEVRRRAGRWELVLEDLRDTVSLEDALEGRAAWPAPPLRVAAHLGRLLAALVEADVRHGDLHAGNVLVGADGGVHLIDLARVRVGVPVAARPLLAGCAAGLRERDPEGFRARALASFRAASGLDVDPEDLEHAARLRRREVVRKRLARYWRESGALREIQQDGLRALLARDVDEDRLVELAGGEPPEGLVAASAASLGLLSERWERAARAAMHRLPSERPVALIRAPQPRAVLAAPPLAPIAGATPEALGATLGAIHDRGLLLDGDVDALALAPDGCVWIDGGTLREQDDLDQLGPARGWFERTGVELTPGAVRAFLDAGRGGAGERRRLEAAWSGNG